MGVVSTKLRKSAKAQPCTFRIPGICNRNAETTILCHAPNEVKGMGNKGDDYHAAFGCSDCHDALDQHKLSKYEEAYTWLLGIMRTQRYWVKAGLIVVPQDTHKPKKSDKIMPRRELWRASHNPEIRDAE